MATILSRSNSDKCKLKEVKIQVLTLTLKFQYENIMPISLKYFLALPKGKPTNNDQPRSNSNPSGF